MADKKAPDDGAVEKQAGMSDLAALEDRVRGRLRTSGPNALTTRGNAAPTPTVRAGAVILAIDTSGSMAGPKLVQAKAGAIAFAQEGWRKGYKVGVLAFASDVEVVMAPERRTEALAACLARLYPVGSTNMADAIATAAKLLSAFAGDRVICLCTDGEPDDPVAAEAQAEAARKDGIEIITVGIEPSDRGFLAKLSVKPERQVMVQPNLIEDGLRRASKLLPG